MFKFDFKVDPSDDGGVIKTLDDDVIDSSTKSATECYNTEKIVPNPEHYNNIDLYKLNSDTTKVGSIEVAHVQPGCLIKTIAKTGKDIAKAECTHSDLIPGIYEGGAKIWECTDDLLQYMSNNFKEEDFDSKHVLDLGCGSGVLGIYTAKLGAVVHFQDYNKDVLENITIPNVILNFPDSTLEDIKKYEFYSGDWSHYTKSALTEEKFDVILTSETIYNPTNYSKLLDTFKEKLKDNGRVLLAAKIYYFGVGGGIREFEKTVENDGTFNTKVLWQSTTDVPREILEIKFKN